MNFVDCYLPYFRQQLIDHQLLALLPFQPLFTESSSGDQLLAFSNSAPLLCVTFEFLVYCSVFFVCVCVWGGGEGQSAQGAMLVYSRGGWGILQYCVMLGAHLLVCQMSIKQVWSQHLVVVRALLFSQCNVARRSFPWARGSGYPEVVILLAALLPPNVAPVSQQGFGVKELMLSASVP
jgi:hypothetical protein